jgi:hypothetical protein
LRTLRMGCHFERSEKSVPSRCLGRADSSGLKSLGMTGGWCSLEWRRSNLATIKKARLAPCLYFPVAGLSALLGDFQVVLHAEDTEHLVGADACDLLIHLVQHRAVESDMAILHEDADGLCRIGCIPA